MKILVIIIVLTNSPKIPDLTMRDIFQLTFFQVIRKDDKSAVMNISAVFWTLLHVDCPRVF